MKIIALNPPFLKGYTRQSRSPSVAQVSMFYCPYYVRSRYALYKLKQTIMDPTEGIRVIKGGVSF